MYGISVWGSGGSPAKLKPIFTVQKRAVRSLFGINRISKFVRGHTKHVFNSNKLLTVHNIYQYSVITETFKLMLCHKPEPVANIIDVSTRHKNLLLIPKGRICSYSSNFKFMAPKLWNLSMKEESVQNISNTLLTSSFKRVIKSFLMNIQSHGEEDCWQNRNYSLIEFNTVG